MTPQDTLYWETRPKDHDHKDWNYEGDWITGYQESIKHPHRLKILEILHRFHFASLLEIGCNVAPNLKLIKKEFSEAILSGIDPNKDAVDRAQNYLGHDGNVHLGDVRELIYDEADVVLCDASLMYITPEEIEDVMNRLTFVAKKAIIIVERFNESKLGEPTGGVWGRDYEKLLKERGFKVDKIKMNEQDWPESPNWQKYGYYFVGTK